MSAATPSLSSPAGQGIAVKDLRQLDTSKLKAIHISEAPDDLFQRFVDMQESMLKTEYMKKPDLSHHAGYDDYAYVVVDGDVVGTLSNNGMLETSNAIGAMIKNELAHESGHQTGPMLAQNRAEMLAEKLGGTIIPAKTAITQSAYRALPPVQIDIDYNAMKQDERYIQLQKTKAARSLYLAQLIAQQTQDAAAGTQPSSS